MELDQIRAELTRPGAIRRDALVAAIDHAEALAPEVIDIIDCACHGAVLTPPQEDLLFYGVHALAAARHADLYENLLALIENRPDEIEAWFGDSDLAAILISVCGAEGEPPYDLLENPNITGKVKSDLFLLVARLVWEGRAPREQFVAFLDRFDREEMAPTDSFAWLGWQDAIRLLGLVAFEARVRAGWQAGRLDFFRPVDRDDWLEWLQRAVRDPRNPEGFASQHAAPIADVFAALNWIRFRDPDNPGGDPAGDGDPLDPAGDIRLDESELEWLGEFLLGEDMPMGTMSPECLDGFMTALIAGPKVPPAAEWQARIWDPMGMADAEEAAVPEFATPEFATEAQEAYIRAALDRHWRAIELRLKAGYPVKPLIDPDMPEEVTEDWAFGFSIGVEMNTRAWEGAARHKQAGPALALILLLLPPEQLAGPGEKIETLKDKERRYAVEQLPQLIATVYAFWHGQPELPLLQERRGPKIGRNEPCPCGSGRKYKKCCGTNA